MYTTLHTVTKKDLLKLLKSKRELFAYVVINPDCGVYFKQSKSAWLPTIESSDSNSWEIALTDYSITIG
jgi:hypothetical protein